MKIIWWTAPMDALCSHVVIFSAFLVGDYIAFMARDITLLGVRWLKQFKNPGKITETWFCDDTQWNDRHIHFIKKRFSFF